MRTRLQSLRQAAGSKIPVGRPFHADNDGPEGPSYSSAGSFFRAGSLWGAAFALLVLAASNAAAIDQKADPPATAKPSTDEMLQDSLDNALLKDLDIPTRPAVPSPDAAKPAQPPADAASDLDQQLLEQLGAGEDLGQQSADPLVSIGRRMRLAERLISRQETSQKTQRVQQQVIEDLERLIEELKKQCQGGQCNSKPSPKPGGKPGQGRAGNGENASANRPAKESTEQPDSKASDREELARLRQMLKQVWGHLPPKIRDQMQSAAIEEFLPKYERLIEEYYSRLAEEGSK